MSGITKDLQRERHSNVPAMLFNLAAFFALFASLASGWPTAHPLWIVAAVLTLAYIEHCWTIIFHEDAHNMLYAARWHNVLNGTILGTLLMVPFSVYRDVHNRHHAGMNTPGDWELWPYADPRVSVGFRRWFVWFDLLLGLPAAVWIYNRIFFVRNSPLRDPKLRRRIWAEYALIVVFWTGVIAAVAYFQQWYAFVLAYVIPAYVTGVFQTGRKLVEHLGMPADRGLGGARTIMGRGPIARFVDWTSFHISQHGLHHLYPQMPHQNLSRALEELPAGERRGVFGSHWAAIRDTLPHLWSPGIGVNAPVEAGGNGRSRTSESCATT